MTDAIDDALAELHERRRRRALEALAELNIRWAAGHSRGCVCQDCARLRQVCREAGLWAEIQ